MHNPQTDVKDIFTSHAEDLKLVEEELLMLFQSQAFLIPEIGRHIVRSGGKRLRPLFLLLSAELKGCTSPSRISLAAIIEAIHTASLLHDDVVDGADLRRGNPTAHTVWGNQVVILVGDFLYSRALKQAVDFRSQEIMEALAGATTRMTEGEILQLGRIGDPETSMEEYYQIIGAKTGSLISAACRIGAILGEASPEETEALGRFGMKTGMVFQMADDILDYMADQDELGKQLGKDLGEGKITMPLIRLLSTCSEDEKEAVSRIITERKNSNGNALILLDRLFERYNILEESLSQARSLLEEAKSEIAILPDSEGKEALLCLADYSLQRSR
jgi:octaprenyl-diphosphate synthase